MTRKLAILSTLALALLLGSSVLFAAGEDNPATFIEDEQGGVRIDAEYPVSSLYPHNKDQYTIINKLKIFWEKKLKEETEEDDMVMYNSAKVDRFRNRQGSCQGFSMLWLYTKWLQFTHPEKTYGYNNDWFNSTMEDIASWDGESELSEEKSRDFVRFFAIVDFFQSPNHYKSFMAYYRTRSAMDLSMLDTDGKFLQRTKSTRFYPMDSDELCSLLKKSVSDDSLIKFDVSTGICTIHSCGLFKHGENYYYYDPNDAFGEYRSKSIENIAKHIIKVFRGTYKNKYGINVNKITLSINIYDFGKEYQGDSLITGFFTEMYREVPALTIDDISTTLRILYSKFSKPKTKKYPYL